MEKKNEVADFLVQLKAKMAINKIMFRDDRTKNAQALLDLEICSNKRKEIIKSLEIEDYSEGPLDDKLYGNTSMWVFGRKFKDIEIYIKMTLGFFNGPVICISFHKAEHKINYPLKN